MYKKEDSLINDDYCYPIDDAIAAPYRMTYRTISTTTFYGTCPRPICGAVNENLLDDDDESLYEITKNYLQKIEEEKKLSRKKKQ